MRAVLLFAVPVLLSGCVTGMPADPKAPRMEQVGTCFAYVSNEGGGKYALITGKGDGSLAPKALKSRPMGAGAVDAALAREAALMKIMPECLAVYVKDRAQAAAFVPPPATAKAAAKPAG